MRGQYRSRTRTGRDWTRIPAKHREGVSSVSPGHAAFLGMVRTNGNRLHHTEKPEVDGSIPSLTTSNNTALTPENPYHH